jgi:hypothetical protein
VEDSRRVKWVTTMPNLFSWQLSDAWFEWTLNNCASEFPISNWLSKYGVLAGIFQFKKIALFSSGLNQYNFRRASSF